MKIRNLALLTVLALVAALSSASPSYAQTGVGVDIGKISVDEPLTPGGIYRLPSVGVINTGQEAGDYEVEVSYLHQQKELRPAQEWFTFEPKTFYLEPGQSQPVSISLSIPVNAKPGDYFASIEAHPIVKKTGVSSGVAAATKLYFTVKPASIFAAVVARVSTFFEPTAPTSYIVLGVAGLIGVIFLFRRFFHIRFRVERKE